MKELHNHIPEISIAAISLLIPTLYVLDDLEIISFDFPINPLVASSLCLIALLWVLTLKE
ncbi:hypothetical protein [Streptococcus plurextorum]|uniref:hypothetical protein n=1 Tax=Streptococcus plurextorum TaxID=456876 RepID=UPI0012EB8453|nr:hypothetical protein [Streptococcus plurextorum]